MNGGSTLPLALACREAGVFPSLWPDIWNPVTRENNYDLLNSVLTEYVKSTGTTDLLLGLSIHRIADPIALKIVKSHKISHIEFLEGAPEIESQLNTETQIEFNKKFNVSFLKAKEILNKTKFIRRTYFPRIDPVSNVYALKGSDSAGLNGQKYSTKELFLKQQELTPDAILIPYGGIGTPNQVAEFISLGAEVVAVGTLFAASQESSLPIAVKQKIVNTKQKDLTKIPDTGQNSLLLGNQEEILQDKVGDYDWNRQQSLNKGLSTGTHGLLYLGSAVDEVNEIRTVKEIVEYLTSTL